MSWFSDQFNAALDSAFDFTVDAEAWAASDTGRAMLASFAQAQTEVYRHPTLKNITAWAKMYGPVIIGAAIPGAGWIIIGAELVQAVADAKGLRAAVSNAVETFATAQFPAVKPFIEAAKARKDGLRGMLLAAGLAQVPEAARSIVALAIHTAENGRTGLTDAALSLLPSEPPEARQLAAAALRGDLRNEAIRLALARVDEFDPRLSDIVAAASNGTLRDDALAKAMGYLPPGFPQKLAAAAADGRMHDAATEWALGRLPADAALAVAVAHSPAGTLLEATLARVSPQIAELARAAVAGRFSDGMGAGLLDSLMPVAGDLPGKATEKANALFPVAAGLAANVHAGRSAPIWETRRSQLAALLSAGDYSAPIRDGIASGVIKGPGAENVWKLSLASLNGTRFVDAYPGAIDNTENAPQAYVIAGAILGRRPTSLLSSDLVGIRDQIGAWQQAANAASAGAIANMMAARAEMATFARESIALARAEDAAAAALRVVKDAPKPPAPKPPAVVTPVITKPKPADPTPTTHTDEPDAVDVTTADDIAVPIVAHVVAVLAAGALVTFATLFFRR
jgi:hypothetical protein